ncbi:MAG: putative Ig domain-containing protein [Acidobacteriota bacterium]|nr:MAG: putative Ig domain-containing protein [Acidobacteriota bacterium]
MMNLQRIRQVAVCAALVAAVIAGAEFFPAQPAAGQEKEQQALHGPAAIEQLKQEGQYESVQAAMRHARFSVIHADNTPLGRPAWHAPNPAAGYDAYITEAGVSIAVNDHSYVSLSLHSFGYGHAMQGVGPGEVTGDKQTINVMREGSLREWYVNGPEGLEHGFTLAEPPGARHHGVPLRLALQVNTGWRAVASDDGKFVTLRGAGDRAVQYGKLVVTDSRGRIIPARLTVAEDQVVIEADDHDAAYPLTIDPVFTFQQKLAAADAANGDFFGDAVALSGETLAVGASNDDIGTNNDQGSVYVFTRSGGAWTFQQKITAFDGAADDSFGLSVALHGDTLAAGAYGHNIGANENQGAAYVFTRSGGVWTLQQKITAFDGAMQDSFGGAVALSDYTLVVGASADTIGANTWQGSAYVYTRIGTVWSLQQKIFTAGAAYDRFGGSVSLDGDTVAVGATGADSAHGSVYVFKRYGTSWLHEKKLSAHDGAAGDAFGRSVALEGDTVITGAPGDLVGQNFQQGSAYVYVRNGGDWTFQQKLTANDGAAEDSFGRSVALKGDIAAVSAFRDDVSTNLDQGSVYVFMRGGAVWTQTRKLNAFDGAANDQFGQGVALSSDTLAVGAHSNFVQEVSGRGSAYVFAISPCPAIVLAPASLPGGASGASYQQQITAGGGTGPYQFSLIGGALPPGLTLMTNGSLAGILPASGTYQFTVSATDLSSFCSGSRTYTITVTEPCSKLTIDPPSLPNGTTFTPYSETLTVTNGVEPYKFSVKGKLPPGLSLSVDGVLSGTPKRKGYYSFTVLVSDARGCTGSQAYSIRITRGDIEIGLAPRAPQGIR